MSNRSQNCPIGLLKPHPTEPLTAPAKRDSDRRCLSNVLSLNNRTFLDVVDMKFFHVFGRDWQRVIRFTFVHHKNLLASWLLMLDRYASADTRETASGLCLKWR
jgi:hypothetical protein